MVQFISPCTTVYGCVHPQKASSGSWFMIDWKSLSPFLLFPATIKSQFIENSHDSVYVGDDVTLKCLLIDAAQDSKDVANYVWYLNSELLEKEIYRFFASPSPPSRFPFHFLFSSLPVCFSASLPLCSSDETLETMLTDKKVINNEHFVQRGSELMINNAVKHLSGYYSCIIEFLNSGAKLETPHELINVAGELLDALACVVISESSVAHKTAKSTCFY